MIALAVEIEIQFQFQAFGNLGLLGRELLGAFNQRGYFQFLAHFPIHKGLNVRMIHVQTHHFGGAACCSATLNCARGAIANFKEAHQAGTFAATRKRLIVAAQMAEIGSSAGAIFKQARLARPQIHNAAIAHKIVAHALNKARVRLRMGVGIGGQRHIASGVIRNPMSLRGAVNSVRPLQTCVEPLRTIWRSDLIEQHPGNFVVKSLRILRSGEVAKFLAPMFPATSQTMHDLFH